MNRHTLDPLESRMLMSRGGLVAHAKLAVNADELAADRAAIDAAHATLQAHVKSNQAALAAAKRDLKSERDAVAAKTGALKAELKENARALKLTLDEANMQRKALEAQWRPVLEANAKDIATVEPTETEQEQADDQARAQADIVAFQQARLTLDAELKADRQAIVNADNADKAALKTAERDGQAATKRREATVKALEKRLKDIFQSDRKIVDAAVKEYKKDGGKLGDLSLPKLPKI